MLSPFSNKVLTRCFIGKKTSKGGELGGERIQIHPKRLCFVIEHMMNNHDGPMEDIAPFIYKFSHLSGNCKHNHEQWRREFLSFEESIRNPSPANVANRS